MKERWCRDDLVRLVPRQPLLVAVDSDGCVFDSMTIKQRIFHTGIIRTWGLEAHEDEFRHLAEWVALFSPWRGLNRFELLLRIFEAVSRYSNAIRPLECHALREFVHSGAPLSAEELAKRIAETGDPELQRILEWSRSVSAEIAAVKEMPVFQEAPETLRILRGEANLIIVSQTAEEALVREWRNAGLAPLADVIAGAELGSKASSLATAMTGRWAGGQTLMIGDAPGDLEAARKAECLFFPILPGKEDESWVELRSTGLDRLRNGTYSGVWQEQAIGRFLSVLREEP